MRKKIMNYKYQQSVTEYFLGSLERNVLERVTVDFDDAILDLDASVAVDPAARFDALHQQAHLRAERRVVGHDVDAQRSALVGQHDQNGRQLRKRRRRRRRRQRRQGQEFAEAVRLHVRLAGGSDGFAAKTARPPVHRLLRVRW